MSIAFVVYAQSGAAVTTLIVLVRSVGKRVALIVLNVSAQYVTEQEENTIRIAFALSVAGWGSHSLQHRYPQHLPIKCPKCKLTVMVEPSDKVCPVCGSSLFIPAKR